MKPRSVASAPPPVTASVPPESTRFPGADDDPPSGLATPPFANVGTSNRPPEIVVEPVYAFAVDIVTVPDPCFTTPPLPEIDPTPVNEYDFVVLSIVIADGFTTPESVTAVVPAAESVKNTASPSANVVGVTVVPET